MNKSKRILIAILSTVITIPMFSACGTDETSSGSQAEATTAATTTANAQNSDAAVSADPADPYHITDTPVEFEFAAALPTSWGDPSTKQVQTDLAKQTNVTIKWNYFPLEVAAEKVGVLLASKDLPDAFYTHNNFKLSQANTYGTQGLLMDLTDLIKTNGPHIDAAFQKIDAYDQLKASDGKLYSLVSINSTPDAIKVGTVHSELFMNTEWLKNVSMTMPTTTEEFYSVLKAFKEKDADGDGDATNEIPFSYGPIYGYGDMLKGAFGIIDSKTGMEFDGEKFIPMVTTDNYKNYLTYMSKLYTEGLIDKEVFSHDNEQFIAKGVAHKYGAYVDYGGWNIAGGINYLQGEEAKFDAVPVLAGPDGTKRTQNRTGGVRDACDMAFTRDCSNPEVLMKWVDLYYNTDLKLSTLHLNGLEGLNLKFTDDKHFELLPTPEGMGYGAFRTQQTIPQGPYLLDENSPVSPRSDVVDYKITQDETKGYIEYATNKVSPIIALTVEESDELAIIEADLNEYTKKFEAACISGQKDIEKEWAGHLAQLEKYGYTKMMNIYNEALAR